MAGECIFHDCWNDPERMRSLFAEFRSKSLNPHGWDDKMHIWKLAINEWCRQKKKLRISLPELYSSFEWQGSYPQCLHTVLEEMRRDGNLTTTADFQSQISSRGWISWGLNVFVKQPIGWGWSAIRNSVFGSPPTSNHTHLNTVVLKEMTAKILQRLQEREENTTVSCNSLHIEFKEVCPDLDDFLFIVQQLEYEGKIAVFFQDGQKLIKVIGKKSESVSLTETDIGIVRLQKAQQTIEKETEKLKLEIERCKQEALLAMKSGFKNKAAGYLAKKQRVEKQLDKKLSTLDNIEHMKEQLQQSDSDKEVLNAYQSGVKALKSTVRQDFNLDKLDDTMAEIEDALESHSEIQATLSRSLGREEDAELESELNELLLQDEKELEGLNDEMNTLNLNRSTEIHFPKVPDNSPRKEDVAALLQ